MADALWKEHAEDHVVIHYSIFLNTVFTFYSVSPSWAFCCFCSVRCRLRYNCFKACISSFKSRFLL